MLWVLVSILVMRGFSIGMSGITNCRIAQETAAAIDTQCKGCKPEALKVALFLIGDLD